MWRLLDSHGCEGKEREASGAGRESVDHQQIGRHSGKLSGRSVWRLLDSHGCEGKEREASGAGRERVDHQQIGRHS